ncbi:DMT family transporter [Paenibacillus glycanilyticus]|uniref:DMT family transporter n=1 Tax=Paenibacillus glycanilyticus TaxID=126569 RepID=UPI00203DE7BA|nr:DMT family transporter [Paenibacillus glycanilyticus]MCM3627083.1 DMT family transporter [Paenibacillus glycanilyticus]
MSNMTASSMVRTKSPVRPEFWLVVLGAALWGVDPVFRIILLRTMTSTQIVLLEHVILFLAAAPVLWKYRDDLRGVRLRQLGALLFVSWGGSALATILFTQGLVHGNANAVLLLQKLQPLFAIVLARILLKELLPKKIGPLLVVAMVGTYLLTFGFTLPFGHMNEFVQVGSLLSLGAAALWGGSTVMGRYLLGSMKYESVTSLRFILALPLLVVVTLSEGAAWKLSEGTDIGAVIVNLLLQALLPGLVSLLFYYKGLSKIKASYATIAELSFPMVGVLLNWTVFGQVITSAQLVGFVFIWFTLFMISRQQN